MNNVIIMGRLTRDPDIRFIQGNGGNTAVTRITLAVDKNLTREKRQEMESKNQATADFINVVIWGKLGETVAKYSGKGLRVLVNGRIQTSSYMKDNERRYTTEVLASTIEFLDWKDGNNSGSNFGQNSGQNYQQNNYNQGNFNSAPSNYQNAPQINQPQDFTPTIDEDFEYSADFDPTEDNRIPF